MLRLRADILEKAVWRRLKTALTDSETLRDSLRDSLAELKQRRGQLDKETGCLDKELQAISGKKERLGLAYADGAIAREVFEGNLHILTKREAELLKARNNLDPHVGMELDDLEQSIASLEKMVDGKSGRVLLTELGIWAKSLPEDWIVGRIVSLEKAWDEPGAPEDSGLVKIGDMQMSMVDGSDSSWTTEIPREVVWRNIRQFFERFGIKVYVFRNSVEVRGFLPTEVMEIPDAANDRAGREAIIPSATATAGSISRRTGALPLSRCRPAPQPHPLPALSPWPSTPVLPATAPSTPSATRPIRVCTASS